MAEKHRAFDSQAGFRAWLKAHHATAKEQLVRCYKTKAQDKGLSRGEPIKLLARARGREP